MKDERKDREELEQVRTWRRDLHQIPETELDTPLTAAYIKAALLDTDFTIIELEGAHSSFAAYLDAGKEHTIALRSDMDALPVQEQSGVEFASRHPGCMHACGHDGHMAGLLLAAHRLSTQKQELPANVLLLFQSGEETPGGARLICQSGILELYNVSHVYGLHLWPALKQGEIATRPSEFMARASEVHITIHGRSAHAAKYRQGIDAMETGAKMLLEMYALEQSLPAEQYRLLRFGKMEAGTVCNVVADTCKISGSMRAFLDPVYDFLKTGILDIAKRLEQKSGAVIDVYFTEGYPAVVNDRDLTKTILDLHPRLACLSEPEMISEDFSFYQKQVPGVFFFLGTGTGIPLHNSRFDFDESILLEGASLFEWLVLHEPEIQAGCHSQEA